ncbi:MAG: Crp/Fnr family transcriptional regulator [Bacteroidales bacterium]|nr:Crp/Fnr family transcriptional regulator [Bacteroidales bacterium]
MTIYQNNDKETLIPFGSCLTGKEIEIFQKNSNIVTYNKRENIFRQNTRTSHIMFVKSGYVKIYKEGRNNKFIILKIAIPGEYLGLMSIFGSDMHQYSASAIDSVEVCFIDLQTFLGFVKENGDFAMKIINILSIYGIYIFDRLMSQSHKQLPGRIADVILYFAETIYKSQTFEFPFTRRELAELAGTTKESFIRTLAEFKNDKIIQLNGSEVTINSIKIIKTLSNLG